MPLEGAAARAGKSSGKVQTSLDAQEVENRKRTFRQRKLSITAGNADFSNMVDAILKDADAEAEDGELYMSREMTGKGGVGRAGLASDESLPFPVSMCGTYSCHGIEPRYTHHGVAIKSKINQDRVSNFDPAGHLRTNCIPPFLVAAFDSPAFYMYALLANFQCAFRNCCKCPFLLS